jgi:hypothetical protein
VMKYPMETSPPSNTRYHLWSSTNVAEAVLSASLLGAVLRDVQGMLPLHFGLPLQGGRQEIVNMLLLSRRRRG